jgi:hypothetical protein
MNFLGMMHYAQYWFLIEKRDYGEYSSFTAKCTVAGLFALMMGSLLDIIGFKFYLYVHSYSQSAIFIALPSYLIVHFFSLEKSALEDEENEQYLKTGKMYLDIFTYLPILYMMLKVIFKYST